jgi:hypothetical protein
VPFSHPPGQWATHLLPEGLLGSEVYPFLHVQVLGAVQSAFKQGSRQWGSQMVPVLSRVQPGSQPQTFGPIHLPFLHPLGHSATQVSWISLKPGLQEHLLGPMHTPAPQPPSQKNSHLLVFLLRVNLQQVLQFLCVVSVGNQQYNTHISFIWGDLPRLAATRFGPYAFATLSATPRADWRAEFSVWTELETGVA